MATIEERLAQLEEMKQSVRRLVEAQRRTDANLVAPAANYIERERSRIEGRLQRRARRIGR